jgi:glycopeptide antibiotics resistance protein
MNFIPFGIQVSVLYYSFLIKLLSQALSSAFSVVRGIPDKEQLV